MSNVDEIRQANFRMTELEFLRLLLVKRFPRKAAATSSLRARRVVALHMISEIGPAMRVLFCYAADLYPESVEYRDKIIKMLRLTDVRIADSLQSGVPSEAPQHVEGIWSDVWGGERVHSVTQLNEPLTGFGCWISAVYHRPYGDDSVERVADEGGMVRVDPLNGWTEQNVRAYVVEH